MQEWKKEVKELKEMIHALQLMISTMSADLENTKAVVNELNITANEQEFTMQYNDNYSS